MQGRAVGVGQWIVGGGQLAAVQGQQAQEPGGRHRPHRQAHQETVEESLRHFVGGYLVGGTDDADQRAALAPGPVVEFALVEQGQQRVEDGAVGLEHLVDEGDGRLRQEARGHAFVAVLLQGGDGQRAEQLLGHREAGQQALEVARPGERQVQAPRQFALGGAGRTDQQRVLAGQRRQERQPHDATALDEARLQMVEQGRQALAQTDSGNRRPCFIHV